MFYWGVGGGGDARSGLGERGRGVRLLRDRFFLVARVDLLHRRQVDLPPIPTAQPTPAKIIHDHQGLLLHLPTLLCIVTPHLLPSLININSYLLLLQQGLVHDPACEVLLVGLVGLDLEDVAVDREQLGLELVDEERVRYGGEFLVGVGVQAVACVLVQGEGGEQAGD